MPSEPTRPTDPVPAGTATRAGEPLPEPLARDIAVLRGVLDEVLRESAGPDLPRDLERLLQATVALRADPGAGRRGEATALVAGLRDGRAEQLAAAFTLSFHLMNLAEEHHRARTIRERGGAPGRPVADSIDAAVVAVREQDGDEALREVLGRLEVAPVLTAHPTEARRRAVVEGIRRVGDQLERLDDPRISRAESADVRRRLLEEVAILWRTAPLREHRPAPLDEVRTAMALFDDTIFEIVPHLYRELDRALGPGDAGLRPSAAPAFLRWGTWIGGDRDGNPSVTAEITRATLAIQADHVLRGLEAAARRIARSLTASERSTPPSAELARSLARDEGAFPAVAAALRSRAPGEPHRRALALAAERLAATRTGGTGAYGGPEELLADLRMLQRSLEAAGAPRLAHGELQHLVWQAETFGFHLASLEVRQHASVHARVLAELAPDAAGDAAALDRLAAEGWPAATAPRSEESAEVLATLGAMADLQARHGVEACRRYVVSFTRSAADVVAVRALARLAVGEDRWPALRLDVVPLFESRADLQAAPAVLDDLLTLPGFAGWLDAAGRRLEVMLGYSDSAKDAGVLAANVALYGAQAGLAAWAAERGVALALFHGRGGALGRGGGPANRAILAQAPGSVAGRFKVTEQGEAVFARYGNPSIARRHLEQVTNAVLLVSARAVAPGPAAGWERFEGTIARMAEASEVAYRDLVERPGFGEFLAAVTPLDELAELRIGSRPARRAGRHDLASLRAIPWVFAWTQSRCNLAGWYGLGSGLAAVAGDRGGLDTLRAMHREWPFFTSMLENAEMSLVKADMPIAELYLALGRRPDLAGAIVAEHDRTRDLVLAVTGHDRLLAGRPVLRRAVDLRNPFVDALSFLQLRFLRELRAAPGEVERSRLGDLVRLTVAGVAAGLQNTG